MIRHWAHGDMDKSAWDRLLLACPDRLWYMQSWVLDLSCPGWEALVGDNGAIMPLLWRRKFGVSYLYQPYAMQQQGVFAPRRGAGMDTDFLAAVPSRFRYWDVYLNAAMQVQPKRGDRLTACRSQELPLVGEFAVLRAGYSQGHRRNLRKAGDHPPAIVRDVPTAAFIELFARTTGKRFGNIPPGGMELLALLIEGAKERGQCTLYGVGEGNKLIAAACFMEWEGRAILLKSANDGTGAEQQAMFHIVDRYIADHAGSGLLLDFAGSNTPSVERFNAGFGARNTVYLRLVRNQLPVPFKWFKR